jgi:hypothetical protein
MQVCKWLFSLLLWDYMALYSRGLSSSLVSYSFNWKLITQRAKVWHLVGHIQNLRYERGDFVRIFFLKCVSYIYILYWILLCKQFWKTFFNLKIHKKVWFHFTKYNRCKTEKLYFFFKSQLFYKISCFLKGTGRNVRHCIEMGFYAQKLLVMFKLCFLWK